MKKRYRVGTLLCILALLCSLLVACGEQTPDDTTATDDMENIMDQIAEEGEENAGKDAGEYITPDENDFDWEEVEGGVCITEYTGTATAVRIPDQLDGQPVVAIDRGISMEVAFTGIILPDTVVTIGEEAFSFCTALTEVQFGSGLKTIEENAFIGCSALTEITFNEGLEIVGDSAFSSCSSLRKVTFSSTIHTLESGAFCMSGLETVMVPGNVKTLGRQTFSYCTELKTAEFEEGVESLDIEMFSLCEKLETVTLANSINEIGGKLIWDSPNATLRVTKGSYAESYAIENELPYETV